MARPRLSLLGVRRASALGGLALSCLAGCDAELINLGSSEPLALGGDAGTGAAGASTAGSAGQSGGSPPVGWTWEPEPVLTPEENYAYANGTLTSNLELFFTAQERGGDAVLLHRARHVAGRWTDAMALAFADVMVKDASSPAISLDGTELWFGSRGDGATDIWRSTLSGDTWSTPETFGAPLNSDADDAPRPLAVGKTIMPLSSKRESEHFRIYLAQRATPTAPWQSVSAAQLELVNQADESVDGFLTENGLTLYFASRRGGKTDADLYMATRPNLDSAFGEPAPLIGLPSGADERDPWLTEAGDTLYYSSNRTGLYATYRARQAQ